MVFFRKFCKFHLWIFYYKTDLVYILIWKNFIRRLILWNQFSKVLIIYLKYSIVKKNLTNYLWKIKGTWRSSKLHTYTWKANLRCIVEKHAPFWDHFNWFNALDHVFYTNIIAYCQQNCYVWLATYTDLFTLRLFVLFRLTCILRNSIRFEDFFEKKVL